MITGRTGGYHREVSIANSRKGSARRRGAGRRPPAVQARFIRRPRAAPRKMSGVVIAEGENHQDAVPIDLFRSVRAIVLQMASSPSHVSSIFCVARRRPQMNTCRSRAHMICRQAAPSAANAAAFIRERLCSGR